MSEPQRIAVERLLAKGWIQPLRFRSCVYLFLPKVEGGRRGYVTRDWARKPLRVTATGDVLPLEGWSPEQRPNDSRES